MGNSMAKFLTEEEKREKYGIPVSSRHESEFVYRLTQEAMKLGISMSRYSGMLVKLGYNTKEEIEKMEEKQRQYISSFIEAIAKNEKDAKRLISIYNKIKEGHDAINK